MGFQVFPQSTISIDDIAGGTPQIFYVSTTSTTPVTVCSITGKGVVDFIAVISTDAGKFTVSVDGVTIVNNRKRYGLVSYGDWYTELLMGPIRFKQSLTVTAYTVDVYYAVMVYVKVRTGV